MTRTRLLYYITASMLVLGLVSLLVVPSVITSVKRGNESIVISTLRTIADAQDLFIETDRDNDGITDNAETLAELAEAGLLDDVVSSGTKGGYFFVVQSWSVRSDVGWNATAAPEIPGMTGDRWFYIDETGIVRGSWEGPACPTDPPVEDDE